MIGLTRGDLFDQPLIGGRDGFIRKYDHDLEEVIWQRHVSSTDGVIDSYDFFTNVYVYNSNVYLVAWVRGLMPGVPETKNNLSFEKNKPYCLHRTTMVLL